MRYVVKTHKASETLKGLHNWVVFASETAIRVGDATPGAVLAELRAVLAQLNERWRGKSRGEVLNMPPCSPVP